MIFRFRPLRFQFVARDALFFPPGKASNTLRGALGLMLRRIDGFDPRHARSYARIFEPAATTPGPSGLADWPRPFVFRARHLDGRAIERGEAFEFQVNLFLLDPETLDLFVRAFAELGREGFGPGRGKAELQCVPPGDPVELRLDPSPDPIGRIRVDFLTPTELKHVNALASTPEFPVLFARLRDRLATLSRLYAATPLDIDFTAAGARAGRIAMTHCRIHREEVGRRSSKTGQSHSLGGFVGAAVYEGALAEFLPYLEAARWTGVGRQAVWGKGEIQVAVL